MNDLAVPIVLAFLQEEGIDWKAKLPRIYALFVAMLDHIGHRRFLKKITLRSEERLGMIADLVARVCPVSAIWLRGVGLDDFQWLLAEYILVFKRSFGDVWAVWVRLLAAEQPGIWLSYFLAAFVLRAFPEIVEKREMCIAIMKEMLPRLLQRMDIREIAIIALWLYEREKLTVEEEIEEIGQDSEFMEFADVVHIE
jgi:hypothetical protein